MKLPWTKAFSYASATGTLTIVPEGPVTVIRKSIELSGDVRIGKRHMTPVATGTEMLARVHELADAEPFNPFVIEMPHDRFTIQKRTNIGFTKSGSPKVHDTSKRTWSILNEDHITKCYPESVEEQISEHMQEVIRRATSAFIVAAFVQAVVILAGMYAMLCSRGRS
jgi:hypothetical protein